MIFVELWFGNMRHSELALRPVLLVFLIGGRVVGTLYEVSAYTSALADRVYLSSRLYSAYIQ
jgi:hypothetical protein